MTRQGPPSAPPSAIKRLETITHRLSKIEVSRADLVSERDQLIREVLASKEAGATRVARAAAMSTAAVYKIRNKPINEGDQE
jgi:DNA invertase Pin-like site-specific DNA recombinase